MEVKLTLIETRRIEHTFHVNNVASLEAAKKCALRAATNKFQPNAKLEKSVELPTTYNIDTYNIVKIE